MALYVTRCVLEVNGQSVSDFNTFTETTRVLHKQVNLMNKTGHAEITQRYQCSLGYVVPQTGEEFNWDGVADGTLTIEYDSGKRITFGGVYTLEVGDGTTDGETETVKTISLGAESRTEE